MNVLMIESSEDSPKILLDKAKGLIQFHGRAIMIDPLPFQSAVLEWLRDNVAESNKKFLVEIEMDYINSISQQMFIQILGEVNKYYIFGGDISINWYVNSDDEFFRELIQEFKESFAIPINEVILV